MSTLFTNKKETKKNERCFGFNASTDVYTDRRKDQSESRWSSVARKRKLTHIQILKTILKNAMNATWRKSIQGVAAFATNLCVILKKRGAKRRLRPTVAAPDTSLRSHESLADSVERMAGVRFGSSAKCIPRTWLKDYEGGRCDGMQQRAESREKLAGISLGSLGSSAPLTSAIKARESLALGSGKVAARLVHSNLRREQAGKVG